MELTGGYINRLNRKDGNVTKEFSDGLLSISGRERIQREIKALNTFGGTLAPRLIDSNQNEIIMEYIPANGLETMMISGTKELRKDIAKKAGNFLAKIHSEGITEGIDLYLNGLFLRTDNFLSKSQPILLYENINPQNVADTIRNRINEKEVQKYGLTFTHGDYWLNNILGEKEGKNGVKIRSVIDWELSTIASPFEDFAVVHLWIIRTHGEDALSFWEGYGSIPDQETIDGFLLAKCLDFLSTTTLVSYEREKLTSNNGFYSDKIEVIKEIMG